MLFLLRSSSRQVIEHRSLSWSIIIMGSFQARAHLTSTVLIRSNSSTIKGLEEPEVRTPPILTDGTHFRSLHWTGHYIPDPTLAVAQGTRILCSSVDLWL